jgi:hypothetical protein
MFAPFTVRVRPRKPEFDCRFASILPFHLKVWPWLVNAKRPYTTCELLPSLANRYCLITGATGTGNTA